MQAFSPSICLSVYSLAPSAECTAGGEAPLSGGEEPGPRGGQQDTGHEPQKGLTGRRAFTR